MQNEKKSEYYSEIYSRGYDTSRYNDIYKRASFYCTGKVLDIGCGIQPFKEYVDDYDGFDFADVPGVRKGDLYEEDMSGFTTYVLLEVLEHVDDLKVLTQL